MTYPTFMWDRHKVETQYPESSIRVQFGNSYQFAAPPDSPDQRIFKLDFTGFKYYMTQSMVMVSGSPVYTQTVDLTTNQYINNVGALEAFYQAQRLYNKFTYNHPSAGSVVVRFSKPLLVPKGTPGGNGVVEDFQILLVEQPGG
jgi:hypothetical protein